MLAYRITNDINEINYYKQNKIYYDNKPIFNTKSNSLYEVNTFPNKNDIYKHFYYFPEDAFEIAQLFLKLNKHIDTVYILEYEIKNTDIIDKIGFGNYKRLKRKDYIPQNKLYKIFPYTNATYPVLEIRMNKNDNIYPTNSITKINRSIIIPNNLNRARKLREYILYKLYLEKIINDFNIDYPHDDNGLMIISKLEGNVKKISIPKSYQKLIC